VYGRALDFFKRHDIKPTLLRMNNAIFNALEAYLVYGEHNNPLGHLKATNSGGLAYCEHNNQLGT
jgi:hypothetical protein